MLKQLSEVKAQLQDFEKEFGHRSSRLVTETEPRLLWLPATHTASTSEQLLSRQRDFAAELARRQRETKQKLTELEERLASHSSA